MLRHLLVGLLLFSCSSRALAQKVGDTQEAVIAALGQPQMSGGGNGRLMWFYEGGVRVIFNDRVVVAIEGLETSKPVTPAAPASATMTAVPETKPLPPPPAQVESDPSPADARPADPLPSEAGPAGPAIPRWKLGGVFLAFIGVAVVSIVCQVMILIEAFKASIWWGLGSLFVPFVVLIFIISNWDDVRKPFLVNLGAAGALSVIVFMM